VTSGRAYPNHPADDVWKTKGGDVTEHTNREIERKFLVARVPEGLLADSGKLIEQGYLVADAEGLEVRLRRKDGRCFQTVKSGQGLVRTEVEIELSADQFAALWPLTAERRLVKHRHRLTAAGRSCELDVFAGPLLGLIVAEVEFASLEAALGFAPPEWFAVEVTDDVRFRNSHLAVHGLPRQQSPDRETR
jgi:adenylate cyclase